MPAEHRVVARAAPHGVGADRAVGGVGERERASSRRRRCSRLRRCRSSRLLPDRRGSSRARRRRTSCRRLRRRPPAASRRRRARPAGRARPSGRSSRPDRRTASSVRSACCAPGSAKPSPPPSIRLFVISPRSPTIASSPSLPDIVSLPSWPYMSSTASPPDMVSSPKAPAASGVFSIVTMRRARSKFAFVSRHQRPEPETRSGRATEALSPTIVSSSRLPVIVSLPSRMSRGLEYTPRCTAGSTSVIRPLPAEEPPIMSSSPPSPDIVSAPAMPAM